MSYMEKPSTETTAAKETPATTEDYEIVNMPTPDVAPTPEGPMEHDISIDGVQDEATADSTQEENVSKPEAAHVTHEIAQPELPATRIQASPSAEMTPEATTELAAQAPESRLDTTSLHRAMRNPQTKNHPPTLTSRTSAPYAFKRVPVVSREEQKRAMAGKSAEVTPPTSEPAMPFIFMQSFPTSPSPTHKGHASTTPQHKVHTPPQPKHIRIVAQPPEQPKKPVTVTVRVNGVPVAREVVGDEDIVFDIQAPQPPRADYAAEIARLQRLQEAQEALDRRLWLSQTGIPHRPTLHEVSYNAQPRVYYMY
ncbi:hypothetical protein SPRG_01103 [Saprolegnia parasitica CBS 223.65]|uniref:Uncharacterized protein n=1 Tax=Saprolegnia parasitica (strain CBS 223.65) TaxID=695850 RepID=A0A067CWF7_SAPPC|nr:hypothetical protein SPRG_01103 [Saprolegnia parasitica CBS 223.65]KDO35039.1 hypothetical protein SPRG_01103 [Saprolegnia parasitica CBS 223.65]|eukprot:XP_012194692.1 hypothetical protein SPRG_01103 [Saprolegnia parasitica CBS 223.65]